jgi:hypothetical protein
VLDLSSDLLGGVSISLNDTADDRPLGSDANVVGVETVRGTPNADLLTGGDAADRLEGGSGAGGGGATAPAGGGVAPGGAEDGSGGVGAGQFVDRDGDGVLPGADCDDGRANVRRGARDIPGNGVDEDCKDGDAGRALAGGRLAFEFLASPDGSTKATKLLVRDLSAGGRAELRCTGPGCRGPAKRVGKRGRGGVVNLRKLVKRRLRAGAVLEVRLTAPQATSRVIRFKMRKGRLPKKTTLCLAPGAKKPGRCV